MDERFKEPEKLKIKQTDSESNERESNHLEELTFNPAIGTKLDSRYILEELVGQGGSSSVYRANDSKRGKTVAVKILHPHLATDNLIIERFKREAHAGQTIRHPNVIDIETFSIADNGQVYMIMEYVDGISLQDAIQEDLDSQQVLAIALEICAALASAHRLGIVHRDLKPGNIMLKRSGSKTAQVKVLDFGIAKILPINGDTVLRMTQSTNMLGTFLYMSPEQCLDQDIDERSDIYSLGCLLYEAFTGTPPLQARTVFETMNKHLTEMPPLLKSICPGKSFPEGIEKVLLKAISKKPKDRFQSIEEFQNALSSIFTSPTEIEWDESWSIKMKNSHTEPAHETLNTVPASKSPVVIQNSLNGEPASVEDEVSVTTPVDPDLLVKELKESFDWYPLFTILVVSYGIASMLSVILFLAVEEHPIAFGGLTIFALIFFTILTVMYVKEIQSASKLAPWKEYGSGSISMRLIPRKIRILNITENAHGRFSINLETLDENDSKQLEFMVKPVSLVRDTWVRFSTSTEAPPDKNNEKSLPLLGYIFYDSNDKPMAISVQKDTAWIYAKE